MTEKQQRIDKWLWNARFVRSRKLAAELATSGHVRVNGQRITAASRAVRPGDVLTIALYRGVRVVRVTAFTERRGPPSGPSLYDDLSEDRSPSAGEQ